MSSKTASNASPKVASASEALLWQDTLKDEAGSRQRRYPYAKTRPDQARRDCDPNVEVGGSERRVAFTVGEWVTRWLEHDIKRTRSRNTYALYESIWRVHVAPILAALPLDALDGEAVTRLYARLRDDGASPSIVYRSGATMQRAIEVAKRRGLFHSANPFALVEKPNPRPKEQHVLTLAEARRILAAAATDPLEALFVLLLTTGLRLGEALGLTWSDIDFENSRLLVRRSLIEVGGVMELIPAKIRGSRRSLELGSTALGSLRRRRGAYCDGQESRLVFSSLEGTPLRRSGVTQRHFQQILTRAHVDHITILGLRNAMTSFGISEGIAPTILAECLGHATRRLARHRQTQAPSGTQREAAEAIDALFSKAI